MTPKQTEEMNKFINSQDNESGSFLSKDLIKIRKKSYEAGYKSAMEKAKVLEDSLDEILSVNELEDWIKDTLSQALNKYRGDG
ncbi:MAG: hypothetical protein ACK41T_00735 [Pseudobdellovibrio sp.]